VLDERTRYFRRLRRARAAARRWTVLAGGLTGASAVLVPYQGLGAADAVWAGLAGAAVVLAWWRHADARSLASEPAPDPPDPALAGDRWLSLLGQLPGGYPLAENLRRQRVRAALRGSPAVATWERLDRATRTMQALTGRLRSSDADAVREAIGVESELRQLTDRVAGLERALRAAPAEAQPPLRELRADHLGRLEHGVAAYEQFVVAAAGYLSESARLGDPVGPAVTGLTDATERLRGVTAGLSELRDRYGDRRIPG
jgi:uncharacterized coiled-coil protein SlyX